MKFIGKHITLDQVEEAVRLTKKAGIHSKGFFIMGHPTDTHDTIRKTIDFALKIPLDDISVSMMTPFPGSKLYQIASDYGTFDNDWRKMNELDVVFVPKGLSKNELQRYSKEMFRRFYLRPKIVLNYMKRIIGNPKGFPNYIKGFSAFLKEITS